jgi:Na+/H+-dicarboxylate symporter
MQNKMLLSMILCTMLGIFCGFMFPEKMLSLRWLDSLFIDVLKVIVLPLIFFSIVSSIITMGSVTRFKAIWMYTMSYLLFNVVIAIFISMILFNVFEPGIGIANQLLILKPKPLNIGSENVSQFIDIIFPPNILAAVKEFEITPLVIFSIVFSIACLYVGNSAKPVIKFFVGMRSIFNVLIIWITYITPINLFILLGSTIAESYSQNLLKQSMAGILLFMCIFLLGLFLQFSWQLIIVLLILKKSRKKFILTASKVLLTAFATSSAINSLPISLSVAKEQNINDNVANFVLPFSSTFNLAGTALYEGVAALFFCQVLNIQLSLMAQIGVFMTAIIAGLGAGNIPEGGLIKMALILRSIRVPSSAIALILPFESLLDRLRAVVNAWSDLVCTVTVNHLMTHTKEVTSPLPSIEPAHLPTAETSHQI